MSSLQIPFIYRFYHLWIEPCLTLSGAYLVAFDPEEYHASMPQTSQYSPSSQLVYSQLAASYVTMAFIEMVLLRATTDLKVWRVVILAIVVSDVGHLVAFWREMGTSVFVNPALWSAKEGLAMTLSYGSLFLRTALLLGVGMKGADTGKKKVM